MCKKWGDWSASQRVHFVSWPYCEPSLSLSSWAKWTRAREPGGFNRASVVMVPIILIIIWGHLLVSCWPFNQGVHLFDMKETMQSDIRGAKLKAHARLMVSLSILGHGPRTENEWEDRACLFVEAYSVLPEHSRSLAINVRLSSQSVNLRGHRLKAANPCL